MDQIQIDSPTIISSQQVRELITSNNINIKASIIQLLQIMPKKKKEDKEKS